MLAKKRLKEFDIKFKRLIMEALMQNSDAFNSITDEPSKQLFLYKIAFSKLNNKDKNVFFQHYEQLSTLLDRNVKKILQIGK